MSALLSKQNRQTGISVPHISPSEWQVMSVIWGSERVTASRILLQLRQREPDYHPKTVRTLIGRLTRKGVLTHEKLGREYLYTPRFSKDLCTHKVLEHMIHIYFEGSLSVLTKYAKQLAARNSAQTFKSQEN